jgi:hypothetical protein
MSARQRPRDNPIGFFIMLALVVLIYALTG